MTDDAEFFDTNVLIAASVDQHVHHRSSAARLASLPKGRGFCSSHSIAEAYTNLTRHSKGYGMPLSDAFRILRRIEETFNLVTLNSREMLKAVEHASQNDLRGAIIYDALLMACARKVKAQRIYTHNLKHFRRVAPDLASIIIEP